MSVPLSQMWTVASHVIAGALTGRRRPLVLMLEPLLRCNLACAGCGKIQHPPEILRRQLTPRQCFDAVEECGAPIVSIPGGEPLLHPQIDEIVAGLVARRKFVYLCTNALKLEAALPRLAPSKYLTLSVHLDGPREMHDRAVCREGVYDVAVKAIRAAVAAGHRVTTNTTVFAGADPHALHRFFDAVMALGVEGMMVSPGYAYQRAPDQDHFLARQRTVSLFRQLLGEARRRGWRLNQTPLFVEFLKGNWALPCTPWGSPAYNVFGWQRPCYLLDEGYCASFAELMQATDWRRYGPESGNPQCRDCMVHSGFEPTAVRQTFTSLRGLLATARLTLFGPWADRPIAEEPAREGGAAPPAPSPPMPGAAAGDALRIDGSHRGAPLPEAADRESRRVELPILR